MQNIPRLVTILIGKTAQKLTKLRGGGTALPGLIVEKIDRNFVPSILNTLPYGVVIISGTNGKTTTTKITTQLLESVGLKVFTNPSGSNFVRGIIAALLEKTNLSGKLNADIAVLELDEAHANHFIKQVQPKHALILNVMRDQLDRFGEIDQTAKLLENVAQATTGTVVLNQDDPLVKNISGKLSSKINIQYFGLSPDLLNNLNYVSGDQALHTANSQNCENSNKKIDNVKNNVEVVKIRDQKYITFSFNDKAQRETGIQLDGLYNIINLAASLCLVRGIIGEKYDDKLLQEASKVTPAFGRGETIMIGDLPLEIVLVKNPSGFRLALESYANSPAETMIAINDDYADGRDVSWLWDVSFVMLKTGASIVAGTRAYDMSLRLRYDEVEFQDVIMNVPGAIDQLISKSREKNNPMRIYCTYTAMLEARKYLNKKYLKNRGKFRYE
jgi:UDP-N-acetylmuramyl tripeptide synthase